MGRRNLYKYWSASASPSLNQPPTAHFASSTAATSFAASSPFSTPSCMLTVLSPPSWAASGTLRSLRLGIGSLSTPAVSPFGCRPTRFQYRSAALSAPGAMTGPSARALDAVPTHPLLSLPPKSPDLRRRSLPDVAASTRNCGYAAKRSLGARCSCSAHRAREVGSRHDRLTFSELRWHSAADLWPPAPALPASRDPRGASFAQYARPERLTMRM
ncbi:hypothetical protein B0H15DRAFT_946237 [Mycena belliarum]|uniref:Uncharacterized protein n=1 Tax=Mycena belliarum TaxID=1033014 RepID=A0AAD6XSQ4_9AGAR|nr:hypothetical protein B0H15DRAFT_946237 [Mycena belliae]